MKLTTQKKIINNKMLACSIAVCEYKRAQADRTKRCHLNDLGYVKTNTSRPWYKRNLTALWVVFVEHLPCFSKHSV